MLSTRDIRLPANLVKLDYRLICYDEKTIFLQLNLMDSFPELYMCKGGECHKQTAFWNQLVQFTCAVEMRVNTISGFLDYV